MIPNYLSEIWTGLAPALGDHLWQSTLFAVAAGLLTLALRKNNARARYWLWLAASLKFLIPFSLLTAIGSHLGLVRTLFGTNASFYFLLNTVSRPFTQPTTSVSSVAFSSAGPTSLTHFLPFFLAALWFCGLVTVLFAWYSRWRKISATIRKAAPLLKGREVEALRRMERVGGIRKPVKMFLSSAPLEPGIFGIAHPVLVWPIGISKHLEDAHLEAIVAHEIWHVRRRDNLAAAMHMMVEAIFWFHPMVWWLGARMVDERERACDEGVLESGSEREVYAESILKTCEFCSGFSLACVSGVTGADLEKRIVHIMTPRAARKLDFGKKLLLAAAGLAAFAVPITFGLPSATPLRTETQTEKPAAVQTVEALPVRPNKPAANAALSVSKVASPKTTKRCTKSLRAHKSASPANSNSERKT